MSPVIHETQHIALHPEIGRFFSEHRGTTLAKRAAINEKAIAVHDEVLDLHHHFIHLHARLVRAKMLSSDDVANAHEDKLGWMNTRLRKGIAAVEAVQHALHDLDSAILEIERGFDPAEAQLSILMAQRTQAAPPQGE